jgi:hypothetical protein
MKNTADFGEVGGLKVGLGAGVIVTNQGAKHLCLIFNIRKKLFIQNRAFFPSITGAGIGLLPQRKFL